MDAYLSCVEKLPNLNTNEVEIKRDIFELASYHSCFAKAMEPYVPTDDALMSSEAIDACSDEVRKAGTGRGLACVEDVTASFIRAGIPTMKAVRDQGCDSVDRGFGMCLLKKCKS